MTNNKEIDTVHKYLVTAFAQMLLLFIGDTREVVGVYQNEIQTGILKTQFLDCIIELNDGSLLNIEFHYGNLRLPALTRYGTYNLNLYDYTKRTISQFVLCHGKVANSIKEIITGHALYYRPIIIFFDEMDGDKYLSNIIKKVNKKVGLDGIEKLYLVFIVFMRSKKSIDDLIYELYNLTKQVTNLTEDERYKIGRCHFLLAEKFLSEYDERRIEMEDDIMQKQRSLINISKRFIRNGYRRGRKTGIETGVQTGINQVAINMIRNNRTYEEIAKDTNLSIDEIKTLGMTINR